MKRLKSCLLASAGLVILAVALSFSTSGRAFAQRVGEDCIRICDTASNPLHVIVQGITRVTGDVTINNQNAIATTVTGPVRVTGSPREPLYIRGPITSPSDVFQWSTVLVVGSGGGTVSDTFTVPHGKLLVIESAMGTVTGNNDANPGFFKVSIKTATENTAINHSLPESVASFNPPNLECNVGGLVQLYAGPGSEVEIIFERTQFPTIKPATLELSLSGHYVDVN